MNADHTCHWTRHRRSLLTRMDGSLAGAGIPITVLEHAASSLGLTMTVATSQEDEYTEEVRIGNTFGTIHDGCFISFDNVDPAFEAGLLAGLKELHSTYVGAHDLPPAVFASVRHLLLEGQSVEIETQPRTRTIRVRAYPFGAGWWTRVTGSTTLRYKVEL